MTVKKEKKKKREKEIKKKMNWEFEDRFPDHELKYEPVGQQLKTFI
jgi:hypothetical protein